jgi:hypothetical protein
VMGEFAQLGNEDSEEVMGTLAGHDNPPAPRRRKTTRKPAEDFMEALFAPPPTAISDTPHNPITPHIPIVIFPDGAPLLALVDGAAQERSPPNTDYEYEPTSPLESPSSSSVGSSTSQGLGEASSMEDALDDQSSSEDVIGTESAGVCYPTVVEGMDIEIRPCGPPHARYQRIVVDCPWADTNHLHWTTCEKRRNIGPKTTANFGPMEPFAFIGVWIRRGATTPHFLNARIFRLIIAY